MRAPEGPEVPLAVVVGVGRRRPAGCSGRLVRAAARGGPPFVGRLRRRGRGRSAGLLVLRLASGLAGGLGAGRPACLAAFAGELVGGLRYLRLEVLHRRGDVEIARRRR